MTRAYRDRLCLAETGKRNRLTVRLTLFAVCFVAWVRRCAGAPASTAAAGRASGGPGLDVAAGGGDHPQEAQGKCGCCSEAARPCVGAPPGIPPRPCGDAAPSLLVSQPNNSGPDH